MHNKHVQNLKLLLNSVVGLDHSLAPLSSLTLKVLLNDTQKVKCLKEVSHLTKSVSHIQNTLVGHLKSVLLKDLIITTAQKFCASKFSQLFFPAYSQLLK